MGRDKASSEQFEKKRRKMLEYLEEHGDKSKAEIAEALGFTYDEASWVIRTLVRDGMLRKVERISEWVVTKKGRK